MGVFIGNLQPGTTTSDLLDFFEDADGITEIAIVKKPSKEGELRYGHVEFGSNSQAERAIKQRQRQELYGCSVSLRRFVDRENDNDRRSALEIEASRLERDRRQGDRRDS